MYLEPETLITHHPDVDTHTFVLKLKIPKFADMHNIEKLKFTQNLIASENACIGLSVDCCIPFIGYNGALGFSGSKNRNIRVKILKNMIS